MQKKLNFDLSFSRFLFALLLLILISTMVGCGTQVTAPSTITTDSVKTASVSGQIIDEAGNPIICQLVFSKDQVFNRIQTDPFGRYRIDLPLGQYLVEISKGSLYERQEQTLIIADRQSVFVDPICLKQLYKINWLAGDLHQHSLYSFDGTDSPYDILLSDLAAGLNYGVITDHNDLRANQEFVHADKLSENFIAFPGIEITTNRGHYNALMFNQTVDPSTSMGRKDILRIVKDVRSNKDALIQINHPVRVNDDFMFHDWDLTSKFDLIEIWNGKSPPPYVKDQPNDLSVKKWYQLMNQGLYIPATGGSDNHDIGGNRMFGSTDYQSEAEQFYYQSMFSGTPRTYILPKENTVDGVRDALKQGRSFITNNPLAFLTIGNALPGETTMSGASKIKIEIMSNRQLSHYRLIKNGLVWQEGDLTSLIFTENIHVSLDTNSWILLEVFGEKGDYAITNPIFIS